MKNNFKKTKLEFMKKYKQKVKEWKDSIKVQNPEEYKETDVIELDIGGTANISTTRGTVIKVSFNFITIVPEFSSCDLL